MHPLILTDRKSGSSRFVPGRYALLVTLLLLAGTVQTACNSDENPTPNRSGSPALKTVFADAFRVGAALNPSQFLEHDPGEATLVKQHFNSVTPENVMKWERIHPRPGEYDFEQADRFVAFGEQNDMFTVGHTLVWHSQIPDWVFETDAGEPVSRDTLLRRMRDHIFTVVNRYEGRVDAWDVVNEAVVDDGELRESPWLNIIGPEYIAKAFEYAHKADPEAELYYNDYSLTDPQKRTGTLELIDSLRAKNVPITGIGLQSHHTLTTPTPEQQDSTIEAFANLGLNVMITELDVAVLPRPSNVDGAEITERATSDADVDPYPKALPDSMQHRLANRYADLFSVYVKRQDVIDRITFWGVTDADSWLNDWPIPGRTSYPLLFDRSNEPKPAFDAVIQTARSKSPK